jgi:hypothetical protein
MNNQYLTKFKHKFSKLFKTEDSKFLLATAFKIAMVYLISSLLVFYLIWMVLSLNNVFFEANGFLNFEGMESAFFDFVASRITQNFYYVLIFFILLFFAGVYLAKILLRPFEIIGNFCDKAIEKKQEVYNPDIFSDFKLLTRFSEFFFVYIQELRKKVMFSTSTIPPSFAKVHGPVFDKVFFFHFSLFLAIIAISSSIFITFITMEIYNVIVELAITTIPKSGKEVAYFLKNQKFIFESIHIVAIITLVFSYMILAFHLYNKVSGAVFGFFSTMRSFMKGNQKARIHLVGYPHIRPYSRAFNKYLDQVCREIDSAKDKIKDKTKDKTKE